MRQEQPRALGPGHAQGKAARGRAGAVERSETGAPEIGVERADRRIADDVARRGGRKGRDRHAAGERLEENEPERVGQARKHEDVRGGMLLSSSKGGRVLPASNHIKRIIPARPPQEHYRLRYYDVQDKNCIR